MTTFGLRGILERGGGEVATTPALIEHLLNQLTLIQHLLGLLPPAANAILQRQPGPNVPKLCTQTHFRGVQQPAPSRRL